VSVPAGSFAEALRNAIDRRGLGLERIRDHLQQRGVTISVATLSYWRSGRSRPERKSSLEALPHLEEVLGLPPGALHAVLARPAPGHPRDLQPSVDTLWPETPQARVLSRLDTRWDTELDRISVHDRLVLGPDRRLVSLTARQVLRARVDGPDRRVVMHSFDDAEAHLPEIAALRGCRLGDVAGEPESGVLGAELVFHRPLLRGETVVVEYELRPEVLGSYETSYGRWLRLPISDYLLEVEFHPDARPVSCHTLGTKGEQVDLTLDPTHRVHVVATGCQPTTEITWTWEQGHEQQDSTQQDVSNCPPAVNS